MQEELEIKKEIRTIDPEIFSHYVYKGIKDAFITVQEYRLEFVTPEILLQQLIAQKRFVATLVKNNCNVFTMIHKLSDYIDKLDRVDGKDEYIPEESYQMTELMTLLENDLDDDDRFVCVADVVCHIYDLADSYASYVLHEHITNIEDFLQQLYDAYDTELPESVTDPKTVEDEDNYNVIEDIDPSKLRKAREKVYDSMIESASRLAKLFEGITVERVERIPASDDNQPKRESWEQYVTDLTSSYHRRNPVIGRQQELERTIQVLCRRDKNNPIFVGEPGVGKTAMIYGLAAMIRRRETPEWLWNFTIYSLDTGALIAGASYHGELERRMKELMDGLCRRGNAILFIDEIHNILDTSNSSKNNQDASGLLKPYLEDGRVRIIGATTYKEYNRYISQAPGIARRFQQIDIKEPNIDETVQILKGLIIYYETHHGVRYNDDAIRHAVEKSAHLIADRFLPDKAIDIIDEAGAYRQMHPLLNKKGEVKSQGYQKIDIELINNILAKVCKIDAKALSSSGNESLRDLADRIGSQIYGQDDAITQVVRAVKMSKAGLTMGDKPLASLLFVGPTGVGKTEVCKVLARELGIELIRFDMSEYTEKHTVAKLIGSPAGYVGYEDGGLLTDAIRKTPNCVLLMDEIEKAHSDIYNILLQVMDYARLTDNKGNKADFRNVILVMTSNAGAQFAGQAAVGFGGGQTKGQAMMQTVKKTFKPEFLNRLSGTVVFNDMDRHMAELILDKKLGELAQLLSAKNVTITLTPEARDLLLEKGFTQQYGAREMDRVIQSMLTPLLMDEILFGKLAKGGNATITRSNDKLTL